MPNVSLCAQENEVHYNPIVPETRLVVKYNVTDTSSETTLLFDTTPFIDMELDGVTQPSVVSSYTFNTLGIHTVKYTLVDPTTIGCYYDGVDYLSYFDGAPISEITIPNSVTSIDRNAFAYCSSLTSVTIPNSVTSIGQEAFAYCGNLTTSVTIPNGVTSISDGLFGSCTSLTSVTIPSSVTSIGDWAFHSCRALTSITIPNGVTSIGNGAFNGCTSLTSVVIPDSVTSVDGSVFGGCSGLTSVTIGSGVTSISDGLFGSCTSLTSITIPSGVTSIGIYAFQNCSGLTSITSLATTAPTIQNYTFRYIKTNGTLTVPSGSSGYDTWMGTGNFYLGKYSWTKVEQ